MLDIALFRPLAEFETDMERMIAELKAGPRTPGIEEIFYPGEIEARAEARHLRLGLQLTDDTLAELETLARDAGIECRPHR